MERCAILSTHSMTLADYVRTADKPLTAVEIAPGLFIHEAFEADFEAALDVDRRLQEEYADYLRTKGCFFAAKEVDPAIEHTYAPVMMAARWRRRLEAGDPYALAVAEACEPLISQGQRIRRHIAPFALRFGTH